MLCSEQCKGREKPLCAARLCSEGGRPPGLSGAMGPCSGGPAAALALCSQTSYFFCFLTFVADAIARCFPALAEHNRPLPSSSFCGESSFPFYLRFCYRCRPSLNALQSNLVPRAATCAFGNRLSRFPENLQKNIQVVCQLIKCL